MAKEFSVIIEQDTEGYYVASVPRPLHVVAAENAEAHETIVITVYDPDPTLWEPGFRQRRRPWNA
jgi:hypothetical protein